MYFSPGNSFSFMLIAQNDVGDLNDIGIHWDHSSALTDPDQWNPMGVRHPTLYIKEVQIKHLGRDSRQWVIKDNIITFLLNRKWWEKHFTQLIYFQKFYFLTKKEIFRSSDCLFLPSHWKLDTKNHNNAVHGQLKLQHYYIAILFFILINNV